MFAKIRPLLLMAALSLAACTQHTTPDHAPLPIAALRTKALAALKEKHSLAGKYDDLLIQPPTPIKLWDHSDYFLAAFVAAETSRNTYSNGYAYRYGSRYGNYLIVIDPYRGDVLFVGEYPDHWPPQPRPVVLEPQAVGGRQPCISNKPDYKALEQERHAREDNALLERLYDRLWATNRGQPLSIRMALGDEAADFALAYLRQTIVPAPGYMKKYAEEPRDLLLEKYPGYWAEREADIQRYQAGPPTLHYTRIPQFIWKWCAEEWGVPPPY